jgi:hypothetical protein
MNTAKFTAVSCAALVCLIGCSDPLAEGHGQRMTVHWWQMKDVDSRCHVLEADSLGKDPKSFKSESHLAPGCRRVKGTDCFVYTEEGNYKLFGELVSNCFNTLALNAERER